MVNILPFGTCPVLGGPCVPAPVGPWLNTHEKTMIADAAPGGPLYPAVTMKSFLVCALGGLIEPKKSGQEYKAPGAATTLEGAGGEALSNGGSKTPAYTGRYTTGKQPANTGNPNQIRSGYIPESVYQEFFSNNKKLSDLEIAIDDPEIVIVRQPELYEQCKTHWCYATAAYIMCEVGNHIPDDKIKDIIYYKELMQRGIKVDVERFCLSNPGNDVIDKDATFIHTADAEGGYEDMPEQGLRTYSPRSGSRVDIAGQLYHTSDKNRIYYFMHPIQSYVVDMVTNDPESQSTYKGPKSNSTGLITQALKWITTDTIGKIEVDYWEDWFIKNNTSGDLTLDVSMVRQYITSKFKPTRRIALSLGRKEAQKKGHVMDGGHSIVVTDILYDSHLKESSDEYILKAQINFYDTLDGRLERAKLHSTIEDIFVNGINLESVSGLSFCFHVYYFD